MIASLLAVALLGAAPDTAALEARAFAEVDQVYAAAHLKPPVRDPALSIAARQAAALVPAGKVDKDKLGRSVADALSRAGGWDPAPRTLLLAGTSQDGLLAYLRAQPSLTEDHADTVGIGITANGDRLTMLVLLSNRLADLKPFPRELPVGASAELQVSLRPPLRSPQLVVTGPDGRAETSNEAVAQGQTLKAPLRFPSKGRYAVEVVGRGPEGPRVAALFTVVVGGAAAVADDQDPPEPKDPMAKIDAVLARINRVRAKAHLKPLEHDPALDLIALDHSEDMAKNHFFAHVSPTRGDLHARLSGKYAYVRAGENLGEANGALQAERAIEGSPAHLENTLDPKFTHIGLALYPNLHAGGEVTLLLTEVFAQKPEALRDAAGSVYTTINQTRMARRLAPLGRDPTLDAVAREHLKLMIKDGMPGGERDAEDAALEANDQLQSVAVDLFVASVPDDALRSRNALSSGFNRVGIAAQVVSNRRYGPDRLWICVLYGLIGPGH